MNWGSHHARPGGYAASLQPWLSEILPRETTTGIDLWWWSRAHRRFPTNRCPEIPPHTIAAQSGLTHERTRSKYANPETHWRRPARFCSPCPVFPDDKVWTAGREDTLPHPANSPGRSIVQTPYTRTGRRN